jgi:hypothetical protein
MHCDARRLPAHSVVAARLVAATFSLTFTVTVALSPGQGRTDKVESPDASRKVLHSTRKVLPSWHHRRPAPTATGVHDGNTAVLPPPTVPTSPASRARLSRARLTRAGPAHTCTDASNLRALMVYLGCLPRLGTGCLPRLLSGGLAWARHCPQTRPPLTPSPPSRQDPLPDRWLKQPL